jgi:hypothetical protein
MSQPLDLPDLAEQADADHAAFSRYLARTPAGNKELERGLNQMCARGGGVRLIEAEAPLSVAAILSSWAERYRAQHPDSLVFVHHIGSTRESRRLDNLIFRLLSAIRRARSLPDALPAAPAARLELLPNWLARAAAAGRVVLVLLGLDALEGDDPDQAMAWLPSYLPAGLSLILQAAPGAASEMLQRRGCPRERLPASEVAEEAEQTLTSALEAGDGALLTLLWAARRGVEVDRLAQAAPDAGVRLERWPALAYSNGERWQLAGPQVQDALRRRLLRDGGEQQEAYLSLIELYPDSHEPATLDALPWLLPAAAHWQALGEFLGDAEVLSALLRPGRRDDLFACWREWDLAAQLVAFYRDRLESWRATLPPDRLAVLVSELAKALDDFLDAAPLQPFFELALAQDAVGERERAAVASACGGWLNAQDRHAEAEPLLRQALALRAKALGGDHAETRASRHQLATLLEARGALEQAAELYRETLKLREHTLGPRHAELIPHLINLAAVRKALNDLEAAKPLYQRALDIAQRRYGSRHPTTAVCLDNLAGLLYAGHDYERAENLYQQALGVAEAAFGPEHPATAAAAHNLGTVLDAREEYKAAEALFRRALAIRQQAYGDEHVDTASILHNLAGALDVMGDHAQAEPLYRKAVEIWEKLVGQEHPATATSVNNLADLLRARQAFDEAESLYRRNLKTWTGLYGEEHPHTLMTLAELAALYADQHRDELAEPLLREAVAKTERVLGPDDMQHINSVIKLGVLLRDSGRRDEAIALLRATVAKAEGKLSLLSPRLQKLRRHLEALESPPSLAH